MRACLRACVRACVYSCNHHEDKMLFIKHNRDKSVQGDVTQAAQFMEEYGGGGGGGVGERRRKFHQMEEWNIPTEAHVTCSV